MQARKASTVYSISVRMLVEQGKPGSYDSNNNPRNRKMCPFAIYLNAYINQSILSIIKSHYDVLSDHLPDRDPLDRALMTSLHHWPPW